MILDEYLYMKLLLTSENDEDEVYSLLEWDFEQ
jgi:hypothetical protein